MLLLPALFILSNNKNIDNINNVQYTTIKHLISLQDGSIIGMKPGMMLTIPSASPSTKMLVSPLKKIYWKNCKNQQYCLPS